MCNERADAFYVDRKNRFAEGDGIESPLGISGLARPTQGQFDFCALLKTPAICVLRYLVVEGNALRLVKNIQLIFHLCPNPAQK